MVKSSMHTRLKCFHRYKTAIIYIFKCEGWKKESLRRAKFHALKGELRYGQIGFRWYEDREPFTRSWKLKILPSSRSRRRRQNRHAPDESRKNGCEKKRGKKREIKNAQNVKYTREKGKSERRSARRRHQWKVVEGEGGEKQFSG